jgi:GNAT superfamily N-acetyltransferase
MLPGGLARKLATARQLLATGKYLELFEVASSRILPPGNPFAFWDRYMILRLTYDGARVLPRETPVSLATSDDIAQLSARLPDRAALFQRRVRDGQVCLVVKHDALVVGRAWLILERPSYITNGGLTFRPEYHPSGWWHDVFIDPEHRGRGHMQALVRRAWTMVVGDEDRGALYCEIHRRNAQSLAAHRRCGFSVCSDVLLVAVAGARLSVCSAAGVRHSAQLRWALRMRRN